MEYKKENGFVILFVQRPELARISLGLSDDVLFQKGWIDRCCFLLQRFPFRVYSLNDDGVEKIQ